MRSRPSSISTEASDGDSCDVLMVLHDVRWGDGARVGFLGDDKMDGDDEPPATAWNPSFDKTTALSELRSLRGVDVRTGMRGNCW